MFPLNWQLMKNLSMIIIWVFIDKLFIHSHCYCINQFSNGKGENICQNLFLFIHKCRVLFVAVAYTCFADSETSAASWDGRWDLHCCSYWTDWVKRDIFVSFMLSSAPQSPKMAIWRNKKTKFLREFPAIQPKVIDVVKYQDLNDRTIKVSFLICTFARLCDAVNKMSPVEQKEKFPVFNFSKKMNENISLFLQ